MITMTLNTDAIHKALIQHLTHDLGMDMTAKDCEISVVVGRKSPTKPVPDITATINITDSRCAVLGSPIQSFAEEVSVMDIASLKALDTGFAEVLPPLVFNPEVEPSIPLSLEPMPETEEEEAVAIELANEATKSYEDEEEDCLLPPETPETIFGSVSDEEEPCILPVSNTSSLFQTS